jgi:hypothetical protein
MNNFCETCTNDCKQNSLRKDPGYLQEFVALLWLHRESQFSNPDPSNPAAIDPSQSARHPMD